MPPAILDTVAASEDEVAHLQRVVARLEQRLERLGEVEHALKASRAQLQDLSELSTEWYWEMDEALRFTHLSEGAAARCGFEPLGDLGAACWELAGVEACVPDWSEYRRRLTRRLVFRDVILCRRHADGSLRYHSLSGVPCYDEHGEFRGYRGIGRDITERFIARQHIHRLANYDGLCDLPNRTAFAERVEQALAHAKRTGRPLAVMCLDLDRFKDINDSFGYAAGDLVLREAAARLRDALAPGDLVARIDGDEFGVLIESCVRADEIPARAQALMDIVARPYRPSGEPLHLTASAGVSVFPQDEASGPALLRDADIAMHRAKERGAQSLRFYAAQMNAHASGRMAMESKLRRALESGAFALHYQPKIALRTEAIAGVEALLRWRDADGGWVDPEVFIPVAEAAGLIGRLGEWVLREACRQAAAWRDAGLAPVRIAVNLSARQFLQEDLVAAVTGAMSAAGIAPALLELEVTESLMFDDPDQAAALLRALRRMGVRLALDDFGTGYSSLSYLKRFAFDSVKIDRSFVRDLPHDRDGAAITRAIVAMSHDLRMAVTAEGVENAAQLAFLRACGCDAAQGNYFSVAVAPSRFAALHARMQQRACAPSAER